MCAGGEGGDRKRMKIDRNSRSNTYIIQMTLDTHQHIVCFSLNNTNSDDHLVCMGVITEARPQNPLHKGMRFRVESGGAVKIPTMSTADYFT